MTLSSEQAAEYLGCSVSQISDLVRERKLRGAKIGRGWRFRASWLDDFLEREADRQAAELEREAEARSTRRPTRTGKPDLRAYELLP